MLVADQSVGEKILALRAAVDSLAANGRDVTDVRSELDALTSDFTAAVPSGGLDVGDQLLKAQALQPAFAARALAVRNNILAQFGIDVFSQQATQRLDPMTGDLITGNAVGATGDFFGDLGGEFKKLAGDFVLIAILLVIAYNWERK